MIYNIWVEGFIINGSHAYASYVGFMEGKDFRDAVIKWYNKHPGRALNFNEKYLTDWGCRLYPTESEVRRIFG